MSQTTDKQDGNLARWIFRMAWRDSRGKRLLLILFTSSVVFGIGAIVAIQSLRINLQRIVDEQAKTLLGADVVLQTRQPYSDKYRKFLESLPGRSVQEWRFRSMAVFPEQEESRFIQVRAMGGPLPFYGEMETEPKAQGKSLVPQSGKAIVEESLMLQLGLSPGDTVRLGSETYEIESALIRMAGESEITGFFAPRIYIPMTGIESTGLIQEGSIVRYRTYIAANGDALNELKNLVENNQKTFFADESVSVETVEDRKRSIERVLNNLLDFLNLIGFIALLLGGVGIIGAVNIYLQGKRETIAILRCLGTSTWSAFNIYLLQMMAFGLAGAIAGAGIGIGIQFTIPVLLKSFLPFPVEMQISWSSISTGLVFGWLVVTASALVPLLGIRDISPLRALRANIEPPRTPFRDPLVWLAAGTLFACVLGFTLMQSRRPEIALAFVGGLLVSLALLAGLAWTLRAALRKLSGQRLTYPYRIALGNLYRPNNRTLLLITTLGMGVLLINMLLFVREGLLGQLDIESSEDAANVILIDVQPDQKEAVIQFLENEGTPAEDVLPVVTMRVSEIKDKPMREWKAMEESPVSDWVYTWEFRNTYRDHVLDNAEVIEGEFVPVYNGDEPYPVSLSENVIEDFDAGIGDFITWDIQGVPVKTVVSSIRRVRWQAGRQNFNIVFPLNTIEAAPTVFAISLKSQDRLQTAGIQKGLTGRFPNVSLIDLSLVFSSVEEILNKATFVIKFMAGFTIATGLVVLAGTILGSRYQRLSESVIFRTLGAGSGFIRTVLSVEFLLLGSVAGLSGFILAFAGSWALLHFVFEVPMVFHPLMAIIVILLVTGLTWATGWITSRGIAVHPPLVILRKE